MQSEVVEATVKEGVAMSKGVPNKKFTCKKAIPEMPWQTLCGAVSGLNGSFWRGKKCNGTDPENLQLLCHGCHASKHQEDGMNREWPLEATVRILCR